MGIKPKSPGSVATVCPQTSDLPPVVGDVKDHQYAPSLHSPWRGPGPPAHGSRGLHSWLPCLRHSVIQQSAWEAESRCPPTPAIRGARRRRRSSPGSWWSQPPSCRLRAVRYSGFPSVPPRALYAASTSLVRSLIRRASSSATAARMCRVNRLAWGLSQHTKSTLGFHQTAQRMFVPGEAVQPGDDQGRLGSLGIGDRLGQLRPLGPLTGLPSL